MGSRLGAQRAAARKLGVDPDEYVSRVEAGQKWCRACREWHLATAFAPDASRSDGLSPLCLSVRRIDRPAAARRNARAAGLRWCRLCDAWVQDDRRAGLCAEHQRSEARRWYAAGGHVSRRGRSAARRRRVASVPGWFREELLADPCAYCGGPAGTVDHVIPVARGGWTGPGNVVPACRSCNSRKKDGDPWPWIARMRGEALERLAEQPLHGVGSIEVLLGHATAPAV